MVNAGGLVCNGCGAWCSHAPGIGYYCTNPKCTYDRDQAKAMLDKMHRVADNAGALQARITALEASLAEAEGRVIAARRQALEEAAKVAEQWLEPIMATPHENSTYRSIAQAIRALKDSPPPPTVV